MCYFDLYLPHWVHSGCHHSSGLNLLLVRLQCDETNCRTYANNDTMPCVYPQLPVGIASDFKQASWIILPGIWLWRYDYQTGFDTMCYFDLHLPHWINPGRHDSPRLDVLLVWLQRNSNNDTVPSVYSQLPIGLGSYIQQTSWVVLPSLWLRCQLNH